MGPAHASQPEMEAARLVKKRQHSAAPLTPTTYPEDRPIPPASAQPFYYAQPSLQLPPPLAPHHGSALPVLPTRPSPRRPPLTVNAGDEIDYALYLAEARGVPLSCLTSFLGAAEARRGDSSSQRARSDGASGYAGPEAGGMSAAPAIRRDEQAAVSSTRRRH